MVGSKRRKKLKILTSLFENQCSNNNKVGDDSGSGSDIDNEVKRKKGESKFNCDLCHYQDRYLPELQKSEIVFLESKERTVLKFKYDRDIKILCLKHYRNEVTNFFSEG